MVPASHNRACTPEEQACKLLLSMYAPVQQHTGVEYHVLVTCEGGNRCFGGSTRAAWTIHRADRATSTKYNWQADIRLENLVMQVQGQVDAPKRYEPYAPPMPNQDVSHVNYAPMTPGSAIYKDTLDLEQEICNELDRGTMPESLRTLVDRRLRTV